MNIKKKTQYFNNDALISKSKQQSSFRAVKNLVEAENNIETIQNRIKVLQLNEFRNINKINIQKQQMEKINAIRNQHLEQLRKLGVNKLQREKMVQDVKYRNEQFRKQHQLKMSTIKQETQEEKAKDYSQAVQTRSLNESAIFENKINSLHQKQEKRNTVFQNQEKSKENIVKFYEDKTKSIFDRNSQEINKINCSKEKREKKLSELSNIEMEMIQRHSQSQVAYKEMKSKLDTMLGKIRLEKRKGLQQMKSSIHRDGKENIYSLNPS